MTAGNSRSRQPQALQLPSGHQAIYRDLGSGPAVVFLHGLMGDHRHWLGAMQKLSRNYRCIAFDLLGFGGSSQPQLEYNIALEVQFVREAIATLGLKHYALVGHSLGGWIAATYSLNYPEDLSHLVLVAPAGIGPLPGRDRRLQLLMWPHPILDRCLAAALAIARTLGNPKAIEPLLATRQALLTQPVTRQWVRQRAQTRSAFSTETIAEDIHRIEIPTLVIAAERDTTIPHWHCQTYSDRIPDARLVTLPDSNHRLPLEYWREMLPHIHNFLGERFPDPKQSPER